MYALIVLGTLVWALWEVGLDWWPLAARGGLIVVLGSAGGPRDPGKRAPLGEVATRLACIERLRAVADDMAHVSQRLIAELGEAGDAAPEAASTDLAPTPADSARAR